MARSQRAIVTGLFLLTSTFVVIFLASIHWLLFLLTAPLVFLSTLIYGIGYVTTDAYRAEIETRIRASLDHLDFVSTTTWWPWVARTRSLLLWLGLEVA